MEAFFEPVAADRYLATGHTRGPWSSDLMHAGPPTALLAHACGVRADLPHARLGRICVEILAPVPVGEVCVRTRVVRPGTRVALVEAELLVGDRPAMLARCWFLRDDGGLAVPPTPVIAPPRDRGAALEVPPGWGRGYLDAIDWRWVVGGFEQPGPATVWARPMVDLVAGLPTAPVERLLIVADSASGISAVASPNDWLFVNTDLTVHLLRPPAGEWLWMEAQTSLDPNGSGVAASTIGDAGGGVARTGQLLFVQPRRAAPAPRP